MEISTTVQSSGNQYPSNKLSPVLALPQEALRIWLTIAWIIAIDVVTPTKGSRNVSDFINAMAIVSGRPTCKKGFLCLRAFPSVYFGVWRIGQPSAQYEQQTSVHPTSRPRTFVAEP